MDELKAARVYPRRGGGRGREIVLPPEVWRDIRNAIRECTKDWTAKKLKEEKGNGHGAQKKEPFDFKG